MPMELRILIIEDNPQSRALMEYLVRAFGHTPITAKDGVEGLEVAMREVPDLVVCDIDLPRKNGYEIADALRADSSLQFIPRIAVTALAMVGDRERILSSGFDGYIAKPIEPETFVQEVVSFKAVARARAGTIRKQRLDCSVT